MADEGQNYAMFNSRLLVDVVGDVTDEAMKASRLKEIIGLLEGASSIGRSENRCSRSILESNAVHLRWLQPGSPI